MNPEWTVRVAMTSLLLVSVAPGCKTAPPTPQQETTGDRVALPEGLVEVKRKMSAASASIAKPGERVDVMVIKGAKSATRVSNDYTSTLLLQNILVLERDCQARECSVSLAMLVNDAKNLRVTAQGHHVHLLAHDVSLNKHRTKSYELRAAFANREVFQTERNTGLRLVEKLRSEGNKDVSGWERNREKLTLPVMLSGSTAAGLKPGEIVDVAGLFEVDQAHTVVLGTSGGKIPAFAMIELLQRVEVVAPLEGQAVTLRVSMAEAHFLLLASRRAKTLTVFARHPEDRELRSFEAVRMNEEPDLEQLQEESWALRQQTPTPTQAQEISPEPDESDDRVEQELEPDEPN